MNYLIYPLFLSLLWLSVQATQVIHLKAGETACHGLPPGKNVHLYIEVLDGNDAEISLKNDDQERGVETSLFDEEFYIPEEENDWKVCIYNYYALTSINVESTITAYSPTSLILAWVIPIGLCLLVLCGCCVCFYFTCRNCKCPSGPDNSPNVTFVQAPQACGPTVQTPSPAVEMEELPKKSNKTKDLGTPEYV